MRTRIRPVAATARRLPAEERLRASNRKLRQLWSTLQNIREEERRRIARELHDELGQQLTVLKLDLSWLEERLEESGGQWCEKVRDMKRRADATIKSVRRICNELRPALLDELGLGAAIEWLAADFAKRTGIEVVLDLAGVEGAARGDAIATALFRIAQECLTNVAKHARATQVRISLECGNAALTLCVSDNGIGIASVRAADDGRGLPGIRERAEMLGGHADISFQAGKGTTVRVTVPQPSGGGSA